MKTKYAVRFLNRQTEIETSQTEDEFIATTKQFHDVFALPRYEGYQVWRDNGGVWEAIHGVKESMFVLFAEMLDTAESTIDNSHEVGKTLLENYQAWKQTLNDLETNGARRKCDSALLDSLRSKIDLVHQALWELKADLKDVNVFEIFTFLTDSRKTNSVERERALNVSRATYYRQQSTFLSLLGLWVINRVTGPKFDDLVTPVIKNDHEYRTNSSGVRGTLIL